MAKAWPRTALIGTAISALLATAMVANLFVIQTYERVLSNQAYVPIGTGRSLRLSAPDVREQQQFAAVNEVQQEDDDKTDIQRLLDRSKAQPHKPEPEGLKMAWLMSFPNSGTSFTSRLVRDATKTDSASNYADETPSGEDGLRLPVYEDQPDGPFWIKPEASPEFTEPTEYVITKVCLVLDWLAELHVNFLKPCHVDLFLYADQSFFLF